MSFRTGEATSHMQRGTLPEALDRELSDRWDDMRMAAASIAVNPIGAVAAPDRDDVETDFPGTLLFSGTLDNIIGGTIQVTHAAIPGSDLKPHIHWTKPAGGAGDNVTWEFYYRIIRRHASPDAWVGPVAGTLAVNHDGIAEAEAVTTFGTLSLAGLHMSANIAWRVYRRGSSDAFGDTARFIELDFHAHRNSRGSIEEF